MHHIAAFVVVICFVAPMFSADNTPFSCSEALVEMLNRMLLQPHFTRTEAYRLLRVCKFFNAHVTKYRDDNSKAFQESPKLLTNGMKIDDGVVFDVSGNIAYGVHIPKPGLQKSDVLCCFTYPTLQLRCKRDLPNFSNYIVHHYTNKNPKSTIGCLIAFDEVCFNAVFYSSFGKVLIITDDVASNENYGVGVYGDGSMKYSKEYSVREMTFPGHGRIIFGTRSERVYGIAIAPDGTAKDADNNKMSWKEIAWDVEKINTSDTGQQQ